MPLSPFQLVPDTQDNLLGTGGSSATRRGSMSWDASATTPPAVREPGQRPALAWSWGAPSGALRVVPTKQGARLLPTVRPLVSRTAPSPVGSCFVLPGSAPCPQWCHPSEHCTPGYKNRPG